MDERDQYLETRCGSGALAGQGPWAPCSEGGAKSSNGTLRLGPCGKSMDWNRHEYRHF